MGTSTVTKMLSICAIAISFWAATAGAQDYPVRPIRFIVGFAAGGSSDVLARAVAKAMSDGLGQPMVLENRPGVGGHVGAEAVARSATDGYTLFFGTNGTLAIGPGLYTNLKYDPLKDLVPVGMLHKLSSVLIVHPSIPATNLLELIAYARSRPGELTFASAGSGSVSHLSGELLKSAAHIDIVHVPYKGGGAAIPDLLAGRVSMMLETIPNALPPVRSGKLRALGVTTLERSSAAPELATFSESGLPGFDVASWTGLFAPFGTPRSVIERLNRESVRIAHDPAYREQLKAMGTDAVSSTPEGLGTFMRADIARWAEAIKRSGARVE